MLPAVDADASADHAASLLTPCRHFDATDATTRRDAILRLRASY